MAKAKKTAASTQDRLDQIADALDEFRAELKPLMRDNKGFGARAWMADQCMKHAAAALHRLATRR